MSGDSVTGVEAADSQDDGGERQRSTIGFPYMGLTDAIEVAKAIHEHVGSGGCDDDQLAVWLGLSPKSSGYRVRISTARMFGVIESDTPGQHRLSGLGMRIVDSSRSAQAKVQAFLNVPLFKAVYEKWQSSQLPPRAGLERELVGLGVAEKQKDRARQVLERSAQAAGFFDHGKDRLVKPGIKPDEKPQDQSRFGGGNGGDGGGKQLDPVIKGLIDKLPEPGTVWGEAERKLWLQILENSFKLVYKDEPSKGPAKESAPAPHSGRALDFSEDEQARRFMDETPDDTP